MGLRVSTDLFCPHCHFVTNILGELPRGELECDCGGILERFEADECFELTAAGLAVLGAAQRKAG